MTTASSRSRALAAIATLATVPLLLTGCFFPSGGATSTPTGETVDPALKPYYSQVISWQDCEDGFQCATVIAPMDWSNPSPETDIELAIVRQPATGGSAMGSLFTNPGGPGASGYDFVRDSVDFAVSEDLQAGSSPDVAFNLAVVRTYQ